VNWKATFHNRQIQKHQPSDADHLLPPVHRVILLLKCWPLCTRQWAVAHEGLEDYRDESTFRFNRRKSA
jgi:hypothetical protein